MESKELLTIAKEIYTNNTKDGSFTLGAGCYNKKNHSYVYFWLFIDEIEDEHLLYVMKCSKISFLSLNDSYFPISELKEEIKKDIERKKEMYPRTLEEIAIDLYDRIERYNGGLDTTFAGIIFDKNSLEIGLANDFYTQNCYGDVVYKYKWEYINRVRIQAIKMV